MNLLEKEMLKYEKKGFKKEQKKTLKYGSRIVLVKKGGFLGTDTIVYIYSVDGNSGTDSLRECFKDFEKYYSEKNFDCEDKGLYVCSGSIDEKLFRDLRQAIIRESDIRSSIKLISTRESVSKKDAEIEKESLEDKEITISSSKATEIVTKVKQFSPLRKPKKEKELEDMLLSFLQHSFAVHPQQTYERATIDARIGSIGIEIKFQPSTGELDRLYGQVEKYLKYLQTVVVVIGYEKNREGISYFEERIEERGWLNKKVYVICLK